MTSVDHPVALPFRTPAPHVPGRTPATSALPQPVQIPFVAPARLPGTPAAGAIDLRTPPTTAQKVHEFIEDTGLVFLLVLAVPTLMVLLALPLIGLARLAARMGLVF